MSDKELTRNKKIVFEECGLRSKDKKSYNVHHVVEKSDIKRKLVPKSFPINERENLIPLPKDIHEELHDLMDNDHRYAGNIHTRVYLANMAFISELDLVPDRLYFTYPIQPRKCYTRYTSLG